MRVTFSEEELEICEDIDNIRNSSVRRSILSRYVDQTDNAQTDSVKGVQVRSHLKIARLKK